MFMLVSGCKIGKIYEIHEGFNAMDAAAEMGIGINLGNEENLCSLSDVIGDGEIIDYKTYWARLSPHVGL